MGVLNSVPHSRTKWPPRRFIETAGKTNPLSSLSLHLRSPFAYMRLHYLRSASLRALASPYSLRPNLPPTSNLPVPTCSPSLLESPSPPPLPVFQPDRNPQEFHFVCQPNYTPQFYTFPSTHAPPSSFLSPSFLVTIPLYSRILPENIPSSSLSLSFLQRERNFNSKDVRKVIREREREEIMFRFERLTMNSNRNETNKNEYRIPEN